MGRYRDLLLHRYRRSLSIALHLCSCAFDQAKNIVNYLRIFHKILAPGGVWINLGLSHRSPERIFFLNFFVESRSFAVALGKQRIGHFNRTRLRAGEIPRRRDWIRYSGASTMMRRSDRLFITIAQDEKTINATYTNNVESMLAYVYHSAMWTAVKK